MKLKPNGRNIGKNKVTPNADAIKDYLICFEALFEHVDYFVVGVERKGQPTEIFDHTRVSRVDEDPEYGFQRALDVHRVRKIAEYIAEGKIVPGAIILSARSFGGILARLHLACPHCSTLGLKLAPSP